jgi:tetratricopeptide (TPR) repeat protein
MQATPFGSTWTTLALLSALAGTGCRNETERLFDEAERAERADDYEGAAHRLREIVISHPESPLASRALLELARIHLLRTRDVTAAQTALVEILDRYPESDVVPSAHRFLGRLFERELADPEKAIVHFRASLETETDTATERETLLSLGECYFRLEQREEAGEAYRRAILLPYDETTDAAYFRLSTLSRLANDREAELHWLDAVAARTEDPGRRYASLAGQVEALVELGRFEDARARLEQAETLSPGAPHNQELEAKLELAASDEAPMDEESAGLTELQEKIPWGMGRARRRDR